MKSCETCIHIEVCALCVPPLPICDSYAENRRGEWIEHKWAEEENGLLISNFECSACHEWERKTSDFCPNCGADMRGESDES